MSSKRKGAKKKGKRGKGERKRGNGGIMGSDMMVRGAGYRVFQKKRGPNQCLDVSQKRGEGGDAGGRG